MLKYESRGESFRTVDLHPVPNLMQAFHSFIQSCLDNEIHRLKFRVRDAAAGRASATSSLLFRRFRLLLSSMSLSLEDDNDDDDEDRAR